MNSTGKESSGSKNIHIIHKVLFLILLTLSTLLFTQLASGCGYKKSTTDDTSLEAAADPVPLTAKSLRQSVAASLGDDSQLRDATMTGEGTEKIINVGINRPMTCEDGSVEAVMAVMSQKILPGLFEHPEVSQVTVTMFGVKQGAVSDDVAAEVFVTRDSAKEIDWSMFGPMTMSMMVTRYYLDPTIMQNSGSGSDAMSGMHG